MYDLTITLETNISYILPNFVDLSCICMLAWLAGSHLRLTYFTILFLYNFLIYGCDFLTLLFSM